MNAFEFHCPTRIICGEHALHKLPVILVEMGVTKPLVVTDANLVALGITDHAIHRLTEAGFPFAFYDQVPPDSSLSVVNDVAAIYEQEAVSYTHLDVYKRQGMTFPIYIGAMIVAAIMRNIGEYTGKIDIRIGEINDLGGICLSLFLSLIHI